jgi:hypothetical protein
VRRQGRWCYSGWGLCFSIIDRFLASAAARPGQVADVVAVATLMEQLLTCDSVCLPSASCACCSWLTLARAQTLQHRLVQELLQCRQLPGRYVLADDTDRGHPLVARFFDLLSIAAGTTLSLSLSLFLVWQGCDVVQAWRRCRCRC